MLFDWFTVIAQGVNFIILVALMRLFLFKPILRAIDERKKKIAAEIADVDKEKADARKESEELKHKNEEFDQKRALLLKKAKDDALAEGQRLIDDAGKKASLLSVKQQEKLKNDILSLNQEISQRTKQEIFSITRKVLKDLAGTSLEERMVDLFIRQLQKLNEKEKKELISAFKMPSGSAVVMVRTTFDLSATQRTSAEGAIKEILGAANQVQFETAPDLISGIELTANGQKVAWSIAEYLGALEKSINELMKKDEISEEKAVPKPK